MLDFTQETTKKTVSIKNPLLCAVFLLILAAGVYSGASKAGYTSVHQVSSSAAGFLDASKDLVETGEAFLQARTEGASDIAARRRLHAKFRTAGLMD